MLGSYQIIFVCTEFKVSQNTEKLTADKHFSGSSLVHPMILCFLEKDKSKEKDKKNGKNGKDKEKEKEKEKEKKDKKSDKDKSKDDDGELRC